jgi:hypothetical protein
MALTAPMLFRRGKLRMAAWYLTLAIFWGFAGLFAVAFVAGCFPLHSWNLEKAWVLLLIGVVAYSSARAALGMRSWIRGFRAGFLELNEQGIRFSFAQSAEVLLTWSEISGITSTRVWVSTSAVFAYPLDTYTVRTPRGAFSFSALDIPRPRRAAVEIAARSGTGIQTAAGAG